MCLSVLKHPRTSKESTLSLKVVYICNLCHRLLFHVDCHLQKLFSPPLGMGVSSESVLAWTIADCLWEESPKPKRGKKSYQR